MFLNFTDEQIGDARLEQFVASVIDNDLNLHYLCVNGCSLTERGLKALVKLLKCKAVELHRVECWVLEERAPFVEGKHINRCSIDLVRELVAVSVHHPTLHTWDYDYYNPNNGNSSNAWTPRPINGFPESVFTNREDLGRDERLISQMKPNQEHQLQDLENIHDAKTKEGRKPANKKEKRAQSAQPAPAPNNEASRKDNKENQNNNKTKGSKRAKPPPKQATAKTKQAMAKTKPKAETAKPKAKTAKAKQATAKPKAATAKNKQTVTTKKQETKIKRPSRSITRKSNEAKTGKRQRSNNQRRAHSEEAKKKKNAP